MNTDNQAAVRAQVAALLRGGQAYETPEAIIDDFPPPLRGAIPPRAEHSAWEILEHMRRTLRDILDFINNKDGSYVQLEWPKDYWPDTATSDDQQWDNSRASLLADRTTLEDLVKNPRSDLFTPFPWADNGQTLLREALLAADHASYHLGQLVLLRRLLR